MTHYSFEKSHDSLIEEIAALKRELAAEKAKNNLVKTSLNIVGFQMQYVRVAAAELKESLIGAIKIATTCLPLKECLETIKLSSARYFSWIKRQVKCALPDQSSCPRLSPTKITSKETLVIKEFVTAKEYSHFSINSLAMLAKREKKVFASVTAWYRIVREYALRRPGIRIYPPKPKIGIRALRPNEIWHIDQSVFRIVNGPRVYIQAIIDNFSRYVLAWKVTETYGGVRTKALIEEALRVANRDSRDIVIPNIFVDSGTENLNDDVDSLVKTDQIIRTIAQIDVEFSNSMIEALFRSLKHRWLFMRSLTSFAAVEQAVHDYLTDHNNVIPHNAFKGAIPIEVYSGTWTTESQLQLTQACATAKNARVNLNRSLGCGLCPT